jgi:GNAT superfamily N-acetyltransferase
MTDVDIRIADPTEYDEVGDLTAAAYLADGPMGDYVDTLRDAKARAGAAELLVAVDDTGIVGTATLVPPGAPEQWRETTPATAATLRMLAVAPAARGRGIGTALTVDCIERARSRGWPMLCLLSSERMQTAQRIYTRLGFVRDPSFDWRIPTGLLLMGYRLDLA